MQPRSIVMALLSAAIIVLTGDHHISQAQQPHTAVTQPETQPTPVAAPTQQSKQVAVKPPQKVATKEPAKETAKETAKDDQPAMKKLVKYQIKSGDTLFDIATAHNTTIEDIQQQNPQVNPDELKIDMILQVPTNTVKKQKTRDEMAQTAEKMVLSSSGEPSNFIKKLSCKLTAYTNSYESTGKYPSDPGYGITASGQEAKEGLTIAVDPSIIPMHSVVYIPGIGVRYAEDTGGAVKGNHIDVFFNDDTYARHFGVKEAVNVYIIEEGTRES